MSERERITAQYLLGQSGNKTRWHDLDPRLQQQFLDDARAYILRQDAAIEEHVGEDPAEEPVAPKAQALDDFQEHVSRLIPSKDWETLREGFSHGWDRGYDEAYQRGWEDAGKSLARVIQSGPGEATQPLPRINVEVLARSMHRKTMALMTWDELTDKEREAYMAQARVELMRRTDG